MTLCSPLSSMLIDFTICSIDLVLLSQTKWLFLVSTTYPGPISGCGAPFFSPSQDSSLISSSSVLQPPSSSLVSSKIIAELWNQYFCLIAMHLLDSLLTIVHLLLRLLMSMNSFLLNFEKMESDQKMIFDPRSFSKAQNLCYLPARVGGGSTTWLIMYWRRFLGDFQTLR